MLVLKRQNKAIETSHSQKHKPCYLGPYKLSQRMKKRSYVGSELDGAPARHGIAANRVIPYISRTAPTLLLLAAQSPENNDQSDTDDDGIMSLNRHESDI